jgi:hypothetical protein
VKFLLDRVAVGKREWRIVADTRQPTAWVIDGKNVYEFASNRDALQYVVGEYRRIADLRSMQPGQNYTLTMSDGTTKMVQVQNQTNDGVQVLDPNSGQSMMIPHIQPGAEPKPAQAPQQGGAGQTPKPNQPQNQAATPVSPENQTDRTYSLALGDLKVTASEYGRTPQNCKHDGTHLNRKNPSDPEKFCPDCGMVYAAERKKATWEDIAKEEKARIKLWQEKNKKKKKDDDGEVPKAAKVAVITGGPGSYHVKSEEGKNLGGPYKTREQAEHRLEQVEYFKHKGKTAGCDSDYWMEGDDCSCPLHRKKKARTAFRAWKNRERIVHAFDIIAQPPMPGNQAMPSGDVSNEGQTIVRDEKSPADFAEEPDEHNPTNKTDPNAKRKLTPHEIIEEAESLIRNALVKGVKIGAAELSDYMTTYYNNPPDELMQGIALAWQKVQYEEQMESPGDQNAPGGEGFGPKPPTTPEEAAQFAPRNGPIRTRNML